MSYIPNTDADRAEMLSVIGKTSIDDLFADVPAAKRFPKLDLLPALSEIELRRYFQQLAEQNLDASHGLNFLGAGAYQHFIPAAINHLILRGEFYSAYTPYQPEVSQGTLTAIYEYQTLVCQLTGMDVANASMYDGSTATAEAALMAARLTHRDKIVVSSLVHPEYREVVQTFTQGLELPIVSAPASRDGVTDLDALRKLMDDQTACLIVQYPNFFGAIEELGALGEIAHGKGALLIVNVDPIALGLLKAPGAHGADIVVGEGQAMGWGLNFGGPYLGLFACRKEHMRQMPGRLVGRTVDTRGRRGFVLTLQAREQHIRREKATSNICTNEALMALAATVYLALLGKNGLQRVAQLCYHKAHYAASQIAKLDGYALAFQTPFFKEFAVRTPKPVAALNQSLVDRQIIGGYDLGRNYPDMQGTMLLCVTELHTKEDIDRLVAALRDS
ncbi:MAG: aminomethyl-transferring glycine dehydrogenase subunit GcvPA [Chloroflexi bacterium]|nr:MAG: aminomethyl-transferring glycine dehydrogenase subunit GcvPA [Chloroflexota bacterium]